MSGGPAIAASAHQIDYLYINARELGYLPLPEPPRGSTEETNKEWVRWTWTQDRAEEYVDICIRTRAESR